MTITPNASQGVTIYEDTDLLTIGHFYNNCSISYKSYNLARYLTKGTNIDDVDYNYTWSNGDTELTITAKLPDVDLQASRMLVNPTLSSGSTTTIACFKNNTQGTDVAVVNLVFSINGSINDFTGVMVTCIEVLEASGGGVPGPIDPRALGNDKVAQTGIQFSSTGTTTLTGGAVTVVNNSLANMVPTLSTTNASNSININDEFHLIRKFICNGNDIDNNSNYSYDLLCNPITNITDYTNVTHQTIIIGTGCTSNFTTYDLDTCSFRKEADFYGYVGFAGAGGSGYNFNTNGIKTIQHFIGRYKFGGNSTRNAFNISRYTCQRGASTGIPQGLNQTETDAIVKKVQQRFGDTNTSTTVPNGRVYTGFANSPSLTTYYNYTDANCYTKGNGAEVIGITSRTYNGVTNNTGGYTYIFDPLIIPDATTVKEMNLYNNNNSTTVYKSNITSTGFKVRTASTFKTVSNYITLADLSTTIHLFQSYDSQGNLLA